jgi:hypothetical protein
VKKTEKRRGKKVTDSQGKEASPEQGLLKKTAIIDVKQEQLSLLKKVRNGVVTVKKVLATFHFSIFYARASLIVLMCYYGHFCA